jgi:NDP-sugar pyrophosphorylase family protein
MIEQRTSHVLPPVAILCGGLATRLHPVTLTVPKSMLEVAGKPFISHQLQLLVQAGFRHVVLLCGYLGDQIENFVGDGSHFGCKVEYSFDGPDLLGTGGAVLRALPLLGPDFMLTYGDSYCATNYRRIYEAFKASMKPALMTVFHNEDRWDRSNVEYRDHKIIRYDKSAPDARMTYIDYGVSVFMARVFEDRGQAAAFDLSSIQTDLVAKEQLAGLEVYERFYEIGKVSGLEAADSRLRELLAAADVFKSDPEEPIQ